MIWKHLLAWPVLAIVGIINGIIRVSVYQAALGDLTAHQVSTATGIIFLGLVIYLWSKIWPLRSASQAWIIGFLYLGLTMAFEFLFGHFVMGHPWSRLLYDYNLFAGRLWSLVLVWMSVAPFVFYRLKKQNR